ncbi:MAG: VWA domain-containing protein [Devosia sp.]
MDDDKMTDDTLSTLKMLRASAPSAEAKKLALNTAMLAFDAAQPKKAAAATKAGWRNRWTLGAGLGVPLGTAVAALVLLPLGTQLYTATSNHTDAVPPKTVTTDGVLKKEIAIAASDMPAKQDEVDSKIKSSTLSLQQQPKTARPVAPPKDGEAQPPVPTGTVTEEAEPMMDQLATVALAPMELDRDAAKMTAAPNGNSGLMGGIAQPLPSANAVPQQPSGDTFQKFDENRVKVTRDEPVSTFSIDVDTASYSYVRGLLKDGYLPDPEAVRLEEMINYFPYDYPAPASIDTPFKATMAVIPTPWNPKTELLEIGIKGYVPPATARAPENLTFLIDTSGSMDEPNKLPLLKRSFGLLVDTLQPNDTVSIVTYAGSAGVALKPTKASDRSTILSALDQMVADGSTDGIDGIALAYKVNAEAKGEGTINRVILATDGDFNVGISEPDELKTYIKTQRGNGIFLSVLGFGRGNLDDELMQSLAQNGNGNASYIDTFQEAQKVLVEEGGANLVTIAKDVKIQVEFNPAQVSEYRLIGYETRVLNREDFNNDAVDAGEIGAGHTVTAIYEITPTGSGGDLNDPLRYQMSAAPVATSDEFGFLKMRYKTPEGEVSKLIQTPIGKDLVVGDLAQASTDQRFAASVAAFGQKLKGSNYGEALTWQRISDLANGAKGTDVNGYRAEFVQMVKLAALLNPDHAGSGKSIYDDPKGGKSGPVRSTGGRPTLN